MHLHLFALLLAALLYAPVPGSPVKSCPAAEPAVSHRASPTTRLVARCRGAVFLVVRQVNGQERGIGAGTIIRPDGLAITAAHVARREAKLQLRLADGRAAAARVLWRDASAELAVLRLELPPGSPPLPFVPVCAGRPLLGEAVVAIGHPCGEHWSCSRGIVSGLDREFSLTINNLPRDDPDALVHVRGMLQHDAATNPGSSGGPLLNADGELLGVVSSTWLGKAGISYAVPCERVREFVRLALLAEKR